MTYQSQANGLGCVQSAVREGLNRIGRLGLRAAHGRRAGRQDHQELYDSNEVTQDLMHSKGRHGLRKTSGSYTCELSLDNCDSFYEAFFRGTWANALTVTEATASGADLHHHHHDHHRRQHRIMDHGRLPRRRCGAPDRPFHGGEQLAQSAHHGADRDRHDGRGARWRRAHADAVADTAFTITRRARS
jgi:hypothetical protein